MPGGRGAGERGARWAPTSPLAPPSSRTQLHHHLLASPTEHVETAGSKKPQTYQEVTAESRRNQTERGGGVGEGWIDGGGGRGGRGETMQYGSPRPPPVCLILLVGCGAERGDYMKRRSSGGGESPSGEAGMASLWEKARACVAWEKPGGHRAVADG